MAIVLNSFDVTLADGSGTAHVMNNQVVLIEGTNGDATLKVSINGESLFAIESSDDITTAVTGLLALAGTFVTLPTDGGDIYLNALHVKFVEPVDGSNSIVWYDDQFGELINKYEVAESAAAVNTKIQAL
jgi:hypothetical protein